MKTEIGMRISMKYCVIISSHENKKALSPFYHKKYFSKKMNVRHP